MELVDRCTRKASTPMQLYSYLDNRHLLQGATLQHVKTWLKNFRKRQDEGVAVRTVDKLRALVADLRVQYTGGENEPIVIGTRIPQTPHAPPSQEEHDGRPVAKQDICIVITTKRMMEVASDAEVLEKSYVTSVSEQGEFVMSSAGSIPFRLCDGSFGILKGGYHVLYMTVMYNNKCCLTCINICGAENDFGYRFMWDQMRKKAGLWKYRCSTGIFLGDNFGAVTEFVHNLPRIKHQPERLNCYFHTVKDFKANKEQKAQLGQDFGLFMSDVRRLRMLPTRTMFEQCTGVLMDYWSGKSTDFVKSVKELRFDSNGKWGNGHSPIGYPASISCLENELCRQFKGCAREKALEHHLGLPLGVGVGVQLIYEEVIPVFSEKLQLLPQEPVVPQEYKLQAKQMYACSKGDVNLYEGKYVCIQRDEYAVLENASEEQYKEAMKLMPGVTTREEFRTLTRIRIFTDKECLICPFYLNKCTCPHVLLAQLMNHKDIDKQDVLPKNRKKGRNKKKKV